MEKEFFFCGEVKRRKFFGEGKCHDGGHRDTQADIVENPGLRIRNQVVKAIEEKRIKKSCICKSELYSNK